MPQRQPKRAPSAVSQVLEARTGIAPAVNASEVRARVIAAITACASADHRVRAGLTLDVGVEPAVEGDSDAARPLDIALVPADTRLEPLGDALVVAVADDSSLAAERSLAPRLSHVGARRFLVVLPSESRLLEWWPEMRDFAVYGAEAIEDRALARPIEVSALFDAHACRELVTRALVDADAWPLPLVREQAVLVERRDALGRLLRARGLAPQRRHLARVEACVDPGQLAAWIERTSRAVLADDVFADSADPE